MINDTFHSIPKGPKWSAFLDRNLKGYSKKGRCRKGSWGKKFTKKEAA